MNDHSAGQLTSITNVYTFPSSINCTLLSFIYIPVLHASKSKCKMFYICYIIINYLLKISINDPNTMFFFIMKNESSFHRTSAVIIVRISRVGQLVFPILSYEHFCSVFGILKFWKLLMILSLVFLIEPFSLCLSFL